MAARRWRWAAYATTGIAVAVLTIGVGGRLGWWRALADDPVGGGWDWVERASWVGGLLALATSVVFGLRSNRVAPAGQQAASAAPQPGPARSAAPAFTPDAGAAAAGDPSFLDRDEERRSLREALADLRSPIVFVHGSPGVGKTRLVSTVLIELGVRAVWHEASSRSTPGVESLIEDIELAAGVPGVPLRRDETLLGRLEAAVEALDGRSVVIVLDAGEHLMHDATDELDVALDEAFDALVSRPPHGVKVVLIALRPPRTAAVGAWGAGAGTALTVRSVAVTGLPFEYFDGFLKVLSRGRSSGLASLDAASRVVLYRWLYGNPRLAELFHAATTMTENRPDPGPLAAGLTGMSFEMVGRHVTGVLISGLSIIQRRVVRALAAFAMPVDADAVVALIAGERSQDRAAIVRQIGSDLGALVDCYVIRRQMDGMYFLPPGEIDRMLAAASEYGTPKPEDRSDLFFRAANVLTDRRTPDEDVRRVDDLRVHFAEIDALLRAREFDAAFGLIKSVDSVLERWNAGFLLLRQREAVEEELSDDDARMTNYNRLGYLYQTRRLFLKADAAYGMALRLAAGQDEITMRIYGNLAGMYLARNEPDQAYLHFDQARAMAMDRQDHGVLMGALDGLARCYRRHGAYDNAIECGMEALATAQTADSPRAVHIASRLTRWYVEVGRCADAVTSVDVARRVAEQHGGDSLRAVALDALADLQLGDGDHWSAISTARQAVDLALPMCDQVTLLQARTTLCLAYLKAGDVPEAAQAIRYAHRYRDTQHSLVVLALLALVCLLTDEPDEARGHFGQLLKEATERTAKDEGDFAAWDLTGIAICGIQLQGTQPLADAIAAFRTARRRSQPAPGLVQHLQFLLEQLQERAHDPDRLRPVLDALSNDPANPGQS